MNNEKNEKAITFTGKTMSSLTTSLKSGMQELKQRKLQQSVCLLLDTSGSMCSDMNDGRRAIDHLRDAVSNFPDAKIISFNSQVIEDSIPEPQGTTDLTLGLETVQNLSNIKKIILVSDGQPNNAESAMKKGMMLKIPISCIYIGIPGDSGYSFLKELATATGGTMMNINTLSGNISNQIAEEIRLQLPKPK